MCFYLNLRVSVSIVIPVYNAEKYLSKCLDSILSQSKKVEIIAVNDGSTDNSLNILNNYASKYSNIKVINQSNQGVSFARNTGMNASTKDYITFVDSDDWLEPDAIQTALKIIKKDNPDILLTSYYDVYNKEWIENIRNKKDAESMQDDVKYSSRSLDKLALYTPFYAKDALSDLYYIGGGVRGRFFSKKFIKQNNLTFPLYL
ncbi:MAG: glycosyltransferase, partial [Alphaproteobacteria bacterium]|nr:glycosyltransferase [Alphaproteobacteria bacterium]